MKQTKQIGFTLIELMIVIVIISVLMAVALPSYRDYVLRSHRVDGKSAISQCASIQERWFTKSNSYNSNAGACPATSPEGYYSITVAVGDMVNDGTCNTGGTTNNDCFEITARPTTKAGQNDDLSCASMLLDNTGRKEAKDSDDVDNRNECWNK